MKTYVEEEVTNLRLENRYLQDRLRNKTVSLFANCNVCSNKHILFDEFNKGLVKGYVCLKHCGVNHIF